MLNANPSKGKARIRKLLAAARAARKQIARDRVTVITSHSYPPGSLRVETVTDRPALAWIAEHDAVLAKLDASIESFRTYTARAVDADAPRGSR
jgi:hypothetical protein